MDALATMPFAAAPAASLNSDRVRIREAFIHDSVVVECGRAQRRGFLRTGIVPRVGQRVDLTVFLDSPDRGDLPFRLSGEVTAVQPMPMWKTGGNDRGDTSRDVVWRPSSSATDYGPMGGSTLLAYIIKKKIPRERARLDGSIPDLNGIWDRVVTIAAKEELTKRVIGKFGALHGQQVVCEGRLNFDYDIRRGSDDGPWLDCIPFDGRDVWRFILVADDSMENIWRADTDSFINLGRSRRERCWPWAEGNTLPFERPSHDLPLRGAGPDGALPIHVCKGPFGCCGSDHPHYFPAIAA
eukprot:CCRYP_003727-RC/>CCRYP_003727-RC protein AED:0.06 eAED:0.06 QI:121/1/1/1/0.5/0.4/5/2078/296